MISSELFAENPEAFPKEVLLDMAIVLSKTVLIFEPDNDDDGAGDWDINKDEDEMTTMGTKMPVFLS
jgi:hypothetical protein